MFSPGFKIVVPVLVVLLSVAYLIYDGVSETMVYYLTVSELKETAFPGKRYRVSGSVAEDSIVRNPGGELVFSINDNESNSLSVSYRGTVPDTFREGAEAVVEGVYSSPENFNADILLAKCPTKYESSAELYPEGYELR